MSQPQNADIRFDTRSASQYCRDKLQSTSFPSPATLSIFRGQGRGAKYSKLGSRVYYTKAALDEWLAGTPIDPARRGN